MKYADIVQTSWGVGLVSNIETFDLNGQPIYFSNTYILRYLKHHKSSGFHRIGVTITDPNDEGRKCSVFWNKNNISYFMSHEVHLIED